MKKYLSALLIIASLAGCATSGSARRVVRVDVNETIDLSGNWNDTDSRLTSEKIVAGLMKSYWLDNFMQKNSRKPVVIVGTIRNLSSEHIETETFVKDIERNLINSGRVKFVANKWERGELRNERMEQQSFSTEETAKKLAAETGADFMLKGSIKSELDAISGTKVKYYQIDMELIDIENNEKVWMDSKKIKKVVNQSKHKW